MTKEREQPTYGDLAEEMVDDIKHLRELERELNQTFHIEIPRLISCLSLIIFPSGVQNWPPVVTQTIWSGRLSKNKPTRQPLFLTSLTAS